MEQPAGHHLAQVNVAAAVDDLDSDRLADFVAALDRVNAIADRSPGFVWRLQDGSGNATGICISDGPRQVVNLSVWENPQDLERFVWKTVHKQVYKRRAKWFHPPNSAHLAMWWVPVGHKPTAEEALARLEDLRTHGPTDRAFGWESLPEVTLWKEHR